MSRTISKIKNHVDDYDVFEIPELPVEIPKHSADLRGLNIDKTLKQMDKMTSDEIRQCFYTYSGRIDKW